ncbi:hypothetical protein [Sinorhizobium arboris]|uniref:hypothetical protein n=1 Tax=Sinorhizobium arboris TaxID=76745 RepID=UPI001F41D95D|nr:hypothetical protein [Sinorhizobium arboris]
MRPGDSDSDLPVPDPDPDPDGSPIHPRELEVAEARMQDEMHRHVQVVQGSQDGNPELARATVERQNTREMSEDEAAAYRLAPEHMLDWLGASAMPDDAADLKVLERWENHLDWLELDQRQPASPAEDGVWHEPERSRK